VMLRALQSPQRPDCLCRVHKFSVKKSRWDFPAFFMGFFLPG
jgi:hypothetical protein